MLDTTTIILCAGPINYRHLPIATNNSNAMIPINGQPVIAWILDDLIEKNIRQATVVLREDDDRLADFLSRTYRDRIDIIPAKVPPGGSIVGSLLAGLKHSQSAGVVRVVLGDTLIRDSYDVDEDFVYVGTVEESGRWCLSDVSSDGIVVDYIDKQAYEAEEMAALAGYYQFLDKELLQKCVEASEIADEYELSFVLRRYGKVRPLKAKYASEWFDFGHIDNLTAARQQLFRPRYFNKLFVNPVLNTITKVSENTQALRDELDWYLELPAELQVLTPRIISHEMMNGNLQIVQEYYGYPTLAELYVFSDLDADTWASILRRIFRIHKEFGRFSSDLAQEDILEMYQEKTNKRLCMLRSQDNFWAELLDQDHIKFNNLELRNFATMETEINLLVENLAETAQVQIIHGDFCFSNILLDLNNQIIRLIDPRGRFGRKGIYGDARYDVAKLRHSVSGYYDFIVSDMFELDGGGYKYSGDIHVNDNVKLMGPKFDAMLIAAGYNLADIMLIEGLLFLSMLPMHRDHPRRQLIMYLTGLSLLNNVIQ